MVGQRSSALAMYELPRGRSSSLKLRLCIDSVQIATEDVFGGCLYARTSIRRPRERNIPFDSNNRLIDI